MLGTTSGLWVPHYYACNKHFTQLFEPQVATGLILPVIVNEFQFNGPFLKLGQNIGLLIGGAFWGVRADIWGCKFVLEAFLFKWLLDWLIDLSDRISFNITLFITGTFALAAGGSPNYIILTSLAVLWSVGVGGNLPVDPAIFLGSFLIRHVHSQRF